MDSLNEVSCNIILIIGIALNNTHVIYLIIEFEDELEDPIPILASINAQFLSVITNS